MAKGLNSVVTCPWTGSHHVVDVHRDYWISAEVGGGRGGGRGAGGGQAGREGWMTRVFVVREKIVRPK